MSRAISLARVQLGLVWPNPAVGCVIVNGGAIISEGATGVGGRPHAEAIALRQCKQAASGATVYVSLEPCCHWGRTPPCTQSLIAADPARVVVAVLDSDPRMRGAGVRALKEAGIEVELGLCEVEAAQVNAGFFQRVKVGYPLLTVVGSGAHMEKHIGNQDAVLSSRATGLFVSFEYHRRRRSGFHATDWFLSPANVDKHMLGSLGSTELILLPEADSDGEIDLKAALTALGHRGLTRLLVDAADPIAARLHSQGLLQADLD
jgi:pyrimidine deaminase RibD-like protein